MRVCKYCFLYFRQDTINAQRLRQELAQRESQLQQAEQRFIHLQQALTVQEAGQAQQAADFQQKLAAKDVAYAQMEQELANVRREWGLLETSVRELRQQATVASHAPTVERNVRLQNSQQVDGDEVSAVDFSFAKFLYAFGFLGCSGEIASWN